VSAPGGGWRAHLARVVLAPLVAALTWAAFPGPGAGGPVLAVGSVSDADVIAPVRFLVVKNEADRAREAEALAATVKPLIAVHPESSQVALRRADAFFARLDSLLATGSDVAGAAAASGITLSRAEAAALEQAAVRSEVRLALARALSRAAAGYLPPGIAAAELGREVVLQEGGSERVVAADSVHTFSDFLLVASAQLPREAAGAERAYVRLLGAFFRPTLSYQRAETELRRDQLRRSVDSVEAVVLAGQKIVGAHEVVTEQAARRVEAMRRAVGGRSSTLGRRVEAAVGRLGLNTLIVALFGAILLLYRPEVYRSWPSMAFFAGGVAVAAVVAGVLARHVPARTELIPVALPTFLFAMLFDSRIAAIAAMAIAALIGAQPEMQTTDALVFCFVGGVAAALSMRRIRSRTQAYASVVAVAAIYAAAAAVSGAAGSQPMQAIGTSAAFGGLNALGSAALAMLLLPLAESFTRVTTDVRLLELSDPNRPLLRRLANEAPGTYAHSVAMANLCEAACNAIGANGLLARVGCYYHDVGKLSHPQHFAENQGRGHNPHDNLSPEQSAAVIRQHVTDGLELAQEYGLPEAVSRFIPEHHGTQEITYFLDRAREDGGDVRIELFRYPGPRPQTAETAVALLADAVEAALRVLDEPTPETIADAIEHLVQSRLEAGQLREAPLTLRQLEIVEQEFVRIITGMYHNRVEYPEDAGGITADWETPRD
jgi:hypothetical protein